MLHLTTFVAFCIWPPPNPSYVDYYFSCNMNNMGKPWCCYICSFRCSWLQEYLCQYAIKYLHLHDFLSLFFVALVLVRHVSLLNKVIDALYLSSIVTKIFLSWLEFGNFFSKNILLLTISNNLFKYYLIVSNSFILCKSNFLIKFKTFMLRIFSFPSYFPFK